MNASGKWMVVGIIVLVAAVGGVLVMSKVKTQESKPETQNLQLQEPVASPTPEVVAETTGKIVDVTVEGSNFKFNQAIIKAKKGDTVKLTFRSSGGIHDLLIDEFGVQTSQLGEGEEEEAEFVADKTGTFEYYCSVGNHRKMGMTGKLVVE